jgi:hypothetical protein
MVPPMRLTTQASVASPPYYFLKQPRVGIAGAVDND